MTTMVVHVVAEWIIAGRTAPNGEGCEGTLNEWNEDKHQQKQQQKMTQMYLGLYQLIRLLK